MLKWQNRQKAGKGQPLEEIFDQEFCLDTLTTMITEFAIITLLFRVFNNSFIIQRLLHRQSLKFIADLTSSRLHDALGYFRFILMSERTFKKLLTKQLGSFGQCFTIVGSFIMNSLIRWARFSSWLLLKITLRWSSIQLCFFFLDVYKLRSKSGDTLAFSSMY